MDTLDTKNTLIKEHEMKTKEQLQEELVKARQVEEQSSRVAWDYLTTGTNSNDEISRRLVALTMLLTGLTLKKDIESTLIAPQLAASLTTLNRKLVEKELEELDD